jgi:hypothetical protein
MHLDFEPVHYTIITVCLSATLFDRGAAPRFKNFFSLGGPTAIKHVSNWKIQKHLKVSFQSMYPFFSHQNTLFAVEFEVLAVTLVVEFGANEQIMRALYVTQYICIE